MSALLHIMITSRILVSMDKSFKSSILPLIDCKASQENKTRADIIRDIMYLHYDYYPEVRTYSQLEYDYNIEAQYNHDGYYGDVSTRTPSLYVCVDRDFLDVYLSDAADKKGKRNALQSYWVLCKSIIADYFHVPTVMV